MYISAKTLSRGKFGIGYGLNRMGFQESLKVFSLYQHPPAHMMSFQLSLSDIDADGRRCEAPHLGSLFDGQVSICRISGALPISV
jgi:hypothetical protein